MTDLDAIWAEDNMEDLAREYYAERAREHMGRPFKSVITGLGYSLGVLGLVAVYGGCFGIILIAIFVVILGPILSELSIGAEYFVGGTAALAALSIIAYQYILRKGLAAYRSGDPAAILEVHNYAVDQFRERIKTHRGRTLGPDSEWERSRTPLQEAVESTHASCAYWRERLRRDPGNQLAVGQLEAAEELARKLDAALAEVDGRANLLRRFYDTCEARLRAMDGHNQDLREIRRLEELHESADSNIARAQATIHALGHAFVEEARTIGQLLSGTGQLQIQALAGEAPLDNMEYLADRIIESSERDRARISELERQLDQP